VRADRDTSGHDIVVEASAGGVEALSDTAMLPQDVDESEADVREAGFEAVPVAQIVVDGESKIVAANRQARTYFGLTQDHVGRRLKDLEVSFRPVELGSRIEEAATEGRVVSLREVEWHGGDDVRYLDLQVTPLISADGEHVGAGITFIDVTRYRRLQEALQESTRALEAAKEQLQSTVAEVETRNYELESTSDELDTTSGEVEQLKALLERLPDGIITIDRRLRIVHANPAAHRLFHPARLQVGGALPAVWGEVSLASFARKLFEGGVTLRDEIRSSNDQVYTVVGIGVGRAATAVVMLEDLTARERRAEAQREFVSNAAHELLTPLTGIVGAAYVLESGAKADPETRDRFIAHIARECDRLARIARALLVLARARSGEEPPRLEAAPLRPLLEDAVEHAGADDTVELRCPDSLHVFVDHDLAEQALTNLVANARRHAPNSPVTISAGESADRTVVIDVSDGGAGILPEQLDRIRRRFATGTGRDSTGFGLGLSIAAQAIEMTGGTITFESVPGEGTHARVELPVGRVRPR
jgi:PAS domain S-box-containing protein